MLFQMIRTLCAEQNVTIAKNPSYIPDRRAVVVKIVGEVDHQKLMGITHTFLEKTGCACEFV